MDRRLQDSSIKFSHNCRKQGVLENTSKNDIKIFDFYAKLLLVSMVTAVVIVTEDRSGEDVAGGCVARCGVMLFLELLRNKCLSSPTTTVRCLSVFITSPGGGDLPELFDMERRNTQGGEWGGGEGERVAVMSNFALG